jgi:hypothetical protein
MGFPKKLFLVSVFCISAAGCTAEQRAAYQAQLDAQQAQYAACTQDDRCRQERQFQQSLQVQREAQEQQRQQAQQQMYLNSMQPLPSQRGTTNTTCTSYVPGTVQCQSN